MITKKLIKMEKQSESIDQDFLLSLKEKYARVRKLLDEESEHDDESQPYRSKYAALDILKNMRDSLQNRVDNSKQCDSKISTMLGVIYLNLGIVSIETEELKSGEEHLMNCIDTLNQTMVQSESILPMISALNQLGILWSRRDQPTKAKTFLERAELAYKEYKSTKDLNPVSMTMLFDLKDEDEIGPRETVEKLHTLTLYYLAQIHGSLENYFESAIYCHETLSRQLQHKDFDSVDWALNVATLSQFFMEKGGFGQAKHHLGAATYILEKYKESLEKNENNEESETLAAKWENFNHRSADVARCWAKYGIVLLSTSKERLVRNAENEQEDLNSNMAAITMDSGINDLHDSLKDLKFASMETAIEFIAGDVTDKYLLDFSDARAVFLKVQKWLEEAKKFYTLENHASDYVQVVQDMSQAYKYLAFFEVDEDRRAKMHKRRVDLLENVVKELNPKYYQAACREIWLELGETYSEILDIKLDRLRSMEERPPPKMLSKINELTTRAIKNLQIFLDSLKEYENPVGTKKFPEEITRPALCSYFHLGRLYNAFITPDKSMQLENTKHSLEAYTFLVNYCEIDSKAKELMIEELNVCKELVKLLPLKVNKLRQECASL